MSISTYPKYESYRDSGVDWIGEVPASWDQVANKHLLTLRKQLVGKHSSEHDLLSLTLRGIIKRDMENPEGKFPAEFDTYQKVRPGDFVFCHFDVEETPRTVGLSFFSGMITGAYTVYELTADAAPNFLYYFYLNADTSKNLRGLYKGLRNTIPKDSFGAFKTLLPSLPEQRAIAAFLDDKCAKIDKAVQIKKAQIKLLAERRQILIQQAVTRGLNPDAPMKDSGIDWIGQIPAHWEVRSIRYAFRFRNNQRIPLSGLEREKMQGEYPYYGASGIIDYVGDYIFDEDLILIAEDGANLLSKSTPLAFVARGKYWVNNHAHILEPLFPGFEYWAEMLSAVDYTIYISGSAQPKLTRDRLGSIRVPVPPSDERKKIIALINQQSAKFQNAISIKQDQITALKEYKTSLINAAVTGKIKIC